MAHFNRREFVQLALSSLGGRELEFLEALVKDPACATMQEGHAPLLSGLARCATYEGKPDRLVRFCCESCIKDFDQEPAKYLKAIDEAAAKAGKNSQPSK